MGRQRALRELILALLENNLIMVNSYSCINVNLTKNGLA